MSILETALGSYSFPTQVVQIRNYIGDYLEKMGKEELAQIILTTHSPFVLSDLPMGNIIYLNKKEEDSNSDLNNTSTFGSNIHTLFQNSSFMNYTIGEFSRNMILELSNNLKRKNQVSKEEYEFYDKQIELLS